MKTLDELIEEFAAAATEVESKLWDLNRPEDAKEWLSKTIDMFSVVRKGE